MSHLICGFNHCDIWGKKMLCKSLSSNILQSPMVFFFFFWLCGFLSVWTTEGFPTAVQICLLINMLILEGQDVFVCVYECKCMCVVISIIFSGWGGVWLGRGRGEGCWLLPFFFVPYPCCLLLSPYQCLCGFTYCTIFLWILFFMCNSHQSNHANKGKCVSKKCTGHL